MVVLFARSVTVTVGDWPGTSLMTTVASNRMFGRPGNGPVGSLTAAVDPEDVRRMHVRVNHALVHADETEAPISQELPVASRHPAGRAAARRSPRRTSGLDDGAVVPDVVLAPDLGDVACHGVADARAEQSKLIQALDRRQKQTPAGRATRL